MDKRLPDLATAVARIEDGARLMIGGFGSAGIPFGLIDALLDHGAKGLTVISNNAGAQETGIAKLLK